jgi:hypothetical protein
MDYAKHYKQEKFNALEDIDLNTNLLIIQEITKKWFSAKPNNPDLILLKDAVLVVSILANKMNYEKSLYYRTIEEYRGDKLRAIERARKAEEQLKTIKPKIENL